MYVCVVPGSGADGVPSGLAGGAEDDVSRAVLERAEQLARKAVDSHPAIHTLPKLGSMFTLTILIYCRYIRTNIAYLHAYIHIQHIFPRNSPEVARRGDRRLLRNVLQRSFADAGSFHGVDDVVDEVLHVCMYVCMYVCKHGFSL